MNQSATGTIIGGGAGPREYKINHQRKAASFGGTQSLHHLPGGND